MVALKSSSALVLGCEGVLIVKFTKGGRSINLIQVDQPMQVHWNIISKI
jgi:predicted metalloenzyme YecM